MKQISKIILANCFQGQKRRGVGNVKKNLGNLLNDYNVSSSIPNEYFNNKRGYNELAEQVYQNHVNRHKTLTVGGDHSISIGSLQGSLRYYKQHLTTIWVDAHADLNTYASSPSGNLHGMPLGFLTGLETNFIQEPYYKLDFNKLKYLGLRDLDEFERKTIFTKDIQHLTAEQLNKEISFDTISIGTRYIHLSLDVDVLDPEYMNSTGTKVDGGISMEKLEEIINWVNKKGEIVSVDLVEYNPELTNDNKVKERDYNNFERIFGRIMDL